ncbi:MAG: magnesium transporter [Caldilineaceae bacterium]|nr:magnesium transporter [Caldilineaceae bacterium]
MVEPISINDAVEQMEQLLEQQDMDRAGEYLRELHPADSAEILTGLEPEEQAALTSQLEPAELAEIFEQMDEEDMVEVAQHLDVPRLAEILDAMDADMATDLLGELDEEEASELLDEMEDASEVQQLLSYEKDTAGGIMNYPPPSLRRWMRVDEAVRFLKEHYHDEDELYYLYVLDRYGCLIGIVSLRAMVLAEPEQSIEEIMNRDVISINVDTDQEEVAQVLSRYDLVALPVTDEQNRLVGIVTVDDVVDVMEEEATEDIYRLAQVSADAEIFSPIHRAIRNRLPWLYINLVTALVAASVVALFQGTIERIAILAAIMPIIAGQGGNAGGQSMTIVVRSLALGEIDVSDSGAALRHELLLGFLHGVVLGVTIGLLTWFWNHNLTMSLVVGSAMLINFIVAGLAGVVIPMLLKRFNVDPALASGVFVTTATDVMGFASLLGLSTLFLRWLV